MFVKYFLSLCLVLPPTSIGHVCQVLLVVEYESILCLVLYLVVPALVRFDFPILYTLLTFVFFVSVMLFLFLLIGKA